MVRGLQPSALPPLREAYCSALNALLRRELRAVSASLRRGGAPAGGPGASGKGGSPGLGGLGPGSPLHSWRWAGKRLTRIICVVKAANFGCGAPPTLRGGLAAKRLRVAPPCGRKSINYCLLKVFS